MTACRRLSQPAKDAAELKHMKISTIAIILSAFVMIGVIALSLGAYNILATEKHWAVTEAVIEWIRESSIKARAKDVEAPPLDGQDRLSTGAGNYDAMCAQCHSAPGREPTELAQGLYPRAPVFHERKPGSNGEQALNRAREHFLVIKHGIKMTAMPAWGPTHDDETIWAMVAFIRNLGGMTAEQYRELTASSQGHHHRH